MGADHAGFELKETLNDYVDTLDSYEVEDLGTYSEDSCDYPDFAKDVAVNVAKTDGSMGILICGTGIGMSMTANKIKGIRAAMCRSVDDAKLSREHNNANILCLGGRVTDEKTAKDIVKVWLKTEFSDDERHKSRVEKIDSC